MKCFRTALLFIYPPLCPTICPYIRVPLYKSALSRAYETCFSVFVRFFNCAAVFFWADGTSPLRNWTNTPKNTHTLSQSIMKDPHWLPSDLQTQTSLSIKFNSMRFILSLAASFALSHSHSLSFSLPLTESLNCPVWLLLHSAVLRTQVWVCSCVCILHEEGRAVEKTPEGCRKYSQGFSQAENIVQRPSSDAECEKKQET